MYLQPANEHAPDGPLRVSQVRIPMLTQEHGKGYFEDRRPAANMDPYEVCAVLIETVCGP